MSREFYRRDFERRPRRETDEDVRVEQSRGKSRSRSNSRPAVQHDTTAEWAALSSRRSSPQPQPVTDPRLRNHSHKDRATSEVPNTATSGTKADISHHGELQNLHVGALKPAQAEASSVAADGTNNTSGVARNEINVPGRPSMPSAASLGSFSPVESLASVLVTFAAQAHLAGTAVQREDVARKRLLAAEKTDQQNRRANKGWTVLIEQGEEDKRTARKLLDDAKIHTQGTTHALAAVATAAAARIIELTDGRGREAKQEREPEAIAHLETRLSTLTQDLAETKAELLQTKMGAQLESKKVEALVKAEKYGRERLEKSVHSVTAEVRHGLNELKSEIENLAADFKVMKNELNVTKSSVTNSHVLPELYAKHDTLTRVESAINEQIRVLRSGQNKLRTDADELRIDIQRLEWGTKPPPALINGSDHDILQELKKLKATVGDLDAKLVETIQRPEYLRLSSMVEIISKQHMSSSSPPVNQDTTTPLSDPSRDRSNEMDRMNQSIWGWKEARKSDHNLLESNQVVEAAANQNRMEEIESNVNILRKDKNAKEKLIFEHLQALSASITAMKADLHVLQKDLKQILQQTPQDINAGIGAVLSVQSNDPTNSQVSVHQPQEEVIELQHATSGLRKDYEWVKTEVSNSQQGIAKLESLVRSTVDGNRGHGHSIRALTQRYNNLTTEDLAQRMLRQLEHLYPHAAKLQASFDGIWKEINAVIRPEYRGLHKSLSDHVSTSIRALEENVDQFNQNAERSNAKFQGLFNDVVENGNRLKKHVERNDAKFQGLLTDVVENGNRLKESVEHNDAKFQGLFNNVVENVTSQRDKVKKEISHDLKKLGEKHATMQTQLAGLREQLNNSKATREDHNAAQSSLNGTSGIPGQRKTAQEQAPGTDSPLARDGGMDYLAGWMTQKPAINVDSSDESDEGPLAMQRSRRARTAPDVADAARSSKKRKRRTPADSLDVLRAQEGQGSALRAKGSRKG